MEGPQDRGKCEFRASLLSGLESREYFLLQSLRWSPQLQSRFNDLYTQHQFPRDCSSIAKYLFVDHVSKCDDVGCQCGHGLSRLELKRLYHTNDSYNLVKQACFQHIMDLKSMRLPG